MLSSWDSRGKVPDMGVMMGEEMLTPFIFLLGDLRAENSAEALDWRFSSGPVWPRLRCAGLAFSFLMVEGVEGPEEEFEALGLAAPPVGMGMGGNSTPLSLASSCSMTYLYMSSSCD